MIYYDVLWIILYGCGVYVQPKPLAMVSERLQRRIHLEDKAQNVTECEQTLGLPLGSCSQFSFETSYLPFQVPREAPSLRKESRTQQAIWPCVSRFWDLVPSISLHFFVIR